MACNCCVLKFLPHGVDEEHLMCFRMKTPSELFKLKMYTRRAHFYKLKTSSIKHCAWGF